MKTAQINSITAKSEKLMGSLAKSFNMDCTLGVPTFGRIFTSNLYGTNTLLMAKIKDLMTDENAYSPEDAYVLEQCKAYQIARRRGFNLGMYYIDLLNKFCRLSDNKPDAERLWQESMATYLVEPKNEDFQMQMMFHQGDDNLRSAMMVFYRQHNGCFVSKIIIETDENVPRGELLVTHYPTITIIQMVKKLENVEALKPLFDQPKYWVDIPRPMVACPHFKF